MSQPDDLVVVHAGNAIETGFIKSLLEEYGIPTILQDEMMGHIAPWYIAAGGVGAVKALIARRDYERAKAIINEFHDAEDSQLEMKARNGARQDKIRPVAIGIIRKNASLFVFEGYDQVKNESFYRPLGGGIEFGEYGAQTLVREFREEVGAEINAVRYLGTLENIFTYQGENKHELVMLYEAEFSDPAFYEKETVIGREGDNQPFKALWKSFAEFQNGQAILYPDGLLEILLKIFDKA